VEGQTHPVVKDILAYLSHSSLSCFSLKGNICVFGEPAAPLGKSICILFNKAAASFAKGTTAGPKGAAACLGKGILILFDRAAASLAKGSFAKSTTTGPKGAAASLGKEILILFEGAAASLAKGILILFDKAAASFAEKYNYLTQGCGRFSGKGYLNFI